MRRRSLPERGAAALMTAVVFIAVALPMAAYAVDLGVQRVARKDAQAIADTVALDMARQLAAHNAAPASVATPVNADATASAQRMSGAAGAPATMSLVVGYINPGSFISDHRLGCGATSYNAYFTSTAGAGSSPAVLVVARASQQRYFARIFGAGPGTVCRSAIGTAAPGAGCFELGSYAANINTSSSVLAPLLNAAGGNLNVTALGYQGLATAKVTLGQLATALGVGTADQLGNAHVTVGQLALAMAGILSNQGDATNATLLNTIAASAGASGAVDLGKTLQVSAGQGSIAGVSVSALDLIGGALAIANGTNLVDTQWSTNLGLASVTAKVTLGEGPKIYCGPVGGSRSTAQASVDLKGTLPGITIPGGLAGMTLTASGQTQVSLTLASATGTLTNIICGQGTTPSPAGLDVSVTSGLATPLISVSQTFNVGGSLGSGLLGALLGSLLGVNAVSFSNQLTITWTINQATNTATVSFRIPTPDSYGTVKSTGSGTVQLNGGSVLPQVSFTSTPQGWSLLGLIPLGLSAAQLNNLISGVASDLTAAGTTLAGVINNLQTLLVQPLTSMLGVKLGGADVIALSPTTCGGPVLAE